MRINTYALVQTIQHLPEPLYRGHIHSMSVFVGKGHDLYSAFTMEARYGLTGELEWYMVLGEDRITQEPPYTRPNQWELS